MTYRTPMLLRHGLVSVQTRGCDAFTSYDGCVIVANRSYTLDDKDLVCEATAPADDTSGEPG